MKLKGLESDISLFNKHRLDNKRFFKEYVGLRFENNKVFRPIISQLRMQNYENANQMLENLVTYGPNKTDAFRFRGEFYFTYHQYLGAWEQYDQILKKHPLDTEALLISSVCAFVLNDLDEYNERLKILKFHTPHVALKLEFYIDLITKYNSLKPFKTTLSDETDIDFIILYGERRPSSGELSADLHSRLQKTLTLANKFTEADLIALGGPVHNKHYEAVASYNWLIEHGISAERIILDMSGLDVVTQTFAIIDLVKQNQYKNLLISSNYDVLPRQFLSLYAALHENQLNDVELNGVIINDSGSVCIPDIESLKIWHTTFRSAGVFTKQFFK